MITKKILQHIAFWGFLALALTAEGWADFITRVF